MANILIIDSNKESRQDLFDSLVGICNDTKIYIADNRDNVSRIIKVVEIHLIFINLNMGNGSGIEIARMIRDTEDYRYTFMICFVNTIKNMLPAYKMFHCYECIINPFNQTSITKLAKSLIEYSSKCINKVRPNVQHLIFKSSGKFIKIFVDEIYFIEVSLKRCIIHTRDEEYSLNRIPLKSVLKMINEDYIVQTHKSFAVNVNYIDRIEKISRGIWKIHFHGYNDGALLAATYKDNLSNKFYE